MTPARRLVSVPLVGQFENVGDIMLRRRLAAWLAPAGRLNVYVGPATPGYVEGLRLPSDAIVHRDLVAWVRTVMAAPRGSGFAFMPGEVVLARAHVRDHLGVVPPVLATKARGGQVVRVGEGLRAPSPLAWLMRPTVALADVLAWRDAATRSVFGRGSVMPDLAFGEGSPVESWSSDRPLLVVSVRADRPAPPSSWLAGVREAAAVLGLSVVAVSQVRMDAASARDLGSALGAEVLAWSDDAGQEDRLRAVYRRARLAVSDRLHVLIAAATEGAVPLGLTPGGQQAKVERHFAAAGMPGTGADCTGWSSADVRDAVVAAASGPGPAIGITEARRRLDVVRDQIHSALGVPVPVAVP